MSGQAGAVGKVEAYPMARAGGVLQYFPNLLLLQQRISAQLHCRVLHILIRFLKLYAQCGTALLRAFHDCMDGLFPKLRAHILHEKEGKETKGRANQDRCQDDF